MKTLTEQTDRMTHAIAATYGSWTSPITADLIVANTISLIGTALAGDDTYWLEMRPSEGGRSVLLKQTPDGRCAEMNALPYSIRNGVHEYGGGSFSLGEGEVFFSNNADQRLYCLAEGQAPRALTSATPEAGPAMRYADGNFDRSRDRWVGVREAHQGEDEPTNTIVAVNVRGEESVGQVLVEGHDFYAAPRVSPNGKQLAWICWSHPDMPWDSTELYVADFQADGSLGEAKLVAGGPTESIVQPTWSPDGRLYFVSDRTDWWNIYRWDGEADNGGAVEAVCPMAAEFGFPQWVFCMDSFAFASAERIVCTYTQNGIWFLGLIDTVTGELETITSPYTEISDIQANGDRAIFIGGSAISPTAVVQLNLRTRQMTVLRSSSDLELDPDYLSEPELVTFPTTAGPNGEAEVAHGIYYAPKNRDFEGALGERPPLLVKSHGGPTAATRSSLNLGIQFWTSRGFAVLDVNYRGSTGYGRAYRERLKGNWGVLDVDDCVYGAKYLTERGDVDGDRLTIDGGSAGGYTTLCALTFHSVFKAGASRYGVSDLTALAEDTHKFEARYLDSLVGPYPASKAVYEERSPINHVEHLSCPVIFFQGLEDRVVPPNQAEAMVNVLKDKGLPVAYVPFEGEQHGFRKAENIKRSLEGQLFFYAQVFGFKVADAIEPVEIANLKAKQL